MYGSRSTEGLGQDYAKKLGRMEVDELSAELQALADRASKLIQPSSDRVCFLIAEHAARLLPARQRELLLLLNETVSQNRRSGNAHRAVREWAERISSKELRNELSFLQHPNAPQDDRWGALATLAGKSSMTQQDEQERKLRAVLASKLLDKDSAEIVASWRPEQPIHNETLMALYRHARNGSALRLRHLAGFFPTEGDWFAWLLVEMLQDKCHDVDMGYIMSYCPTQDEVQEHLVSAFVYDTVVEMVEDTKVLHRLLSELVSWLNKSDNYCQARFDHAGLVSRIRVTHLSSVVDEVPTLPPVSVMVMECWAAQEINEALELTSRDTTGPRYENACDQLTMAVAIAKTYRPTMFPELWRKLTTTASSQDRLLLAAALLAGAARNDDWCAQLLTMLCQPRRDGKLWQVSHSAYWAMRVLLLHFDFSKCGGFATPQRAEEFVRIVYKHPPQERFTLFLSAG